MHTRIIFQGLDGKNALDEVKKVLTVPDVSNAVINTGFMVTSGIRLIEAELSAIADQTTIYTGIRNGITSAQSLRLAKEIGCRVVCVDTGTHERIFHNKLYFAKSKSEARYVVGSSNLTRNGLFANLEMISSHHLNLSQPDDASVVGAIESSIAALEANFPSHVFEIIDDDQIEALLAADRLEDESKPRPRVARSTDGEATRVRSMDQLPVIKLNSGPVPARLKAGKKAPAPIVPGETGEEIVTATDLRDYELMWTSSPLSRRDLSIPDSAGTHTTGSMLWKKGPNEIDQQTYFRDEVFDHLTWEPSIRTPGKEVATAEFELIIKEVNYGAYRLQVTHDTRVNTRTYEQKQPMTDLKWGDALPLIGQEDLLDRHIRLYRSRADATAFRLEII